MVRRQIDYDVPYKTFKRKVVEEHSLLDRIWYVVPETSMKRKLLVPGSSEQKKNERKVLEYSGDLKNAPKLGKI